MRAEVGGSSRRKGPWFWLRPGLALFVAGVLFVAILVLRLSVAGIQDSISMLYVLPVALVALGFGLRAGLAAGFGAVGLLVLWVVESGERLTTLGWLSRVTPLLLLGALVGAAADEIREADRAERHAQQVALLQREAAEINDRVLQELAVAKWLLESGDVKDGVELLEATMDTTQQLVSKMLGSGSPLPGDLRKSRPSAHLSR